MVLRTVYMIDHADAGPYVPTQQNLYPGRGSIPVRKCRLSDCARCDNKAGGWVFPWVDPRWTGQTCLDAPFYDMVALTKRLRANGPGDRLEVAFQPGKRPNIFDADSQPYQDSAQRRPFTSGPVQVWPMPGGWTPADAAATPEEAIDLRHQMLLESFQEKDISPHTVCGVLHGRVFGNPEVARRAAAAMDAARASRATGAAPSAARPSEAQSQETNDRMPVDAPSANLEASQARQVVRTIQQIAALLPLASIQEAFQSVPWAATQAATSGGPPNVFHPAGMPPGLAGAFQPPIMVDSDSDFEQGL
jgi:hypothetical protein